jgi:HPt (histidine-containing phosphotransfer) domain-containing protein
MSFIVPEGKLYNLEMIKEISHGNNDFVKKMMALFNETMPAAIAELKQHLSASNWSDLGAVAHKIKPSIDTVGIELLKEDIRTIEKNAKELSNLSEIPDLLEKLEMVLNKVMDDLNEEMNAM